MTRQFARLRVLWRKRRPGFLRAAEADHEDTEVNYIPPFSIKDLLLASKAATVLIVKRMGSE